MSGEAPRPSDEATPSPETTAVDYGWLAGFVTEPPSDVPSDAKSQSLPFEDEGEEKAALEENLQEVEDANSAQPADNSMAESTLPKAVRFCDIPYKNDETILPISDLPSLNKDDLIARCEALHAQATEIQINWSSELALRRRKEKNLVKVASELSSRSTDLQSRDKQVLKMAQTLHSMEMELGSARTELTETRAKLATVYATSDDSDDLELREELAQASLQRDELRAELDRLREFGTDKSETTQEVIEKLQVDLSQAIKERDELQEKVVELQAIEPREISTASTSVEEEEMSDIIEWLKEELAQMTSERDDLSHQLEDLQQQAGQRNLPTDEVTKSLEEANKKLKEDLVHASMESEALRGKVKGTQKMQEGAQQKLNEMVAQAAAERNALRGELRKLHEEENRTKELQWAESTKSYEDAIQTLKDDLAQAVSERDTVMEELKKITKEGQDKVSQATVERDEVLAQLQKAQEKFESENKENAHKLEHELAQVVTERDAIKKDLENTKEGAKEEVKVATVERDYLRAQLQLLQEELDGIIEAAEQSEEENRQLKDELAQAAFERGAMAAEMQSVRASSVKEIEEITLERDDLCARLEALIEEQQDDESEAPSKYDPTTQLLNAELAHISGGRSGSDEASPKDRSFPDVSHSTSLPGGLPIAIEDETMSDYDDIRSPPRSVERLDFDRIDSVESGGVNYSFLVGLSLVGVLCVTTSWVGFSLARSPEFLDAACSPSRPGAEYSTAPVSLEAPWWAPDTFKEQAFGLVCGSRTRSRLDWNGDRLVLSTLDGDKPKVQWSRRVAGFGVSAKDILLHSRTDQRRGKSTVVPTLVGLP